MKSKTPYLALFFASIFLALAAPIDAQALSSFSKNIPVENVVHRSWTFNRDNDYEGWVVKNAKSNVANGFLTLETNTHSGTHTPSFNFSHQSINIYTSDTEKRFFISIAVKSSELVTAQNISAAAQRIRLSYNRSDINQRETRYINVPKNDQVQGYVIPIASLDPVVLSDIRLEVVDASPLTLVKIDDIQIMDNYTGGKTGE